MGIEFGCAEYSMTLCVCACGRVWVGVCVCAVCVRVSACLCVCLCVCACVLLGSYCTCIPNSLLFITAMSSAHLLGGARCSDCLMCLPGHGLCPMSQPW